MVSVYARFFRFNFQRFVSFVLLCSLFFITASSAQAQGSITHALDFDGTNDKVVIPDNNSLDMTNNYTLEAWVYPTQFINGAGILSKWQTTNGRGYMLRLSGTSGGVSFDEHNTTSNVLTINAWNHVAAVNDNGTRRLYVNGVEVSLGSSTYSVQSNGDPIHIGQDYNDNNRIFKGRIDEVRIWNVVRTASQISEARNKMLIGSESGLVAYYRFDQGTAGGSNTGETTLTNLVASTGSALNGTLTNFALTGTTSNWVTGYSSMRPLLTTTVASSITASSVASGGEILHDGGSAVTARGMVWSISPNPTVSLATKTGSGSGSGTFISTITDLNASTTFYLRSYATNANGTDYGSQVTFTTSSQTQAPAMSYGASSQVLRVGTAISAGSITLTNTGGRPDKIQVSTLAGRPFGGYLDDVGVLAKFQSPFGVAADGSGNVYVADFGNHRIRKITLSTGAVTTLAGSTVGFADGTGSDAKFNGPASLVCDGEGNLYVSDYYNNRIRKIVISTGVVTTVAGGSTKGNADGAASTASFANPIGLDLDGNGNLFVADRSNHRIRKVVLSTGMVSTVAGNVQGMLDGTGTTALLNNPFGIVADVNGFLYVADNGNHRIRKIEIATGVVTTFAGSSSAGDSDGLGAAARFQFPSGVTTDDNGNLYVADRSNNRIRKIVIASAAVSTLAGSNNGSVDGTGTSAKISSPDMLAADVNGNIFIPEGIYGRIRMISSYRIDPELPAGLFFNAATGEITGTPASVMSPRAYTVYAQNAAGSKTTQITLSVTSVPSATTEAATSVTGTAARLNAIVNANGEATTAISFTYSQNADLSGGTTVSTTPGSATAFVNTSVSASISGLTNSTTYYFRVSVTNAIGTTDGSIISFTTAPATPIINYPSSSYSFNIGSAISPVSISNTGGAIDPMSVSTVAGRLLGFENGTGTAAKFNLPSGIAYDGTGNLYVSDKYNHCIRKIVISTGEVSTVAGSGTAAFVDGNGTAAYFNNPSGLALDGSGNLYVADEFNNRIRKIVLLTGQVSTFAGSEAGYYDAPGGSLAKFNRPTGVALDGSGNLYVTDLANNRIRKINISSTEVTTLAGSSYGNNDGTTSASFANPVNIVAEGSGYLYVADQGNGRIRKVTISTGAVTTIAGIYYGFKDGPGAIAQFALPSALAVDATGNLYVADRNNNRIRKITPGGIVTTLVGDGNASTTDGLGSNANFKYPTGIASGANGDLFVADTYNYSIRKLSRFLISPTLPAGILFNTATGEITGTPTALSGSTTYTVTAANAGGTASAAFTLEVSSSLLTTDASDITETTANSGGTVDASFSSVTARGVVWSTAPNPTTTLITKTADGTGTGVFTSTITGLTANTTYYVRSYIEYAGGTEYGSQKTFKTNELGDFSPVTKSFGDAAFSLAAPISVSKGAFSYASSNLAVATISGSEVTITGAGTSTITATQAAQGAYASVNKSMTLTVNPATPIITLSIPNTTKLKDANDMPIIGTASNGSTVEVSIDPAKGVLTPTGPGAYKLNGVVQTGDITFAATTISTTNYAAGSKTVVMNVEKDNQEITFNALTPVTYVTGLTQVLSASTTATGLSVDFEVVSGPGSLTGSTLNISGPGNILIRAKQAGNSAYNAAPEVERSLTVNPAAPVVTSFAPASATEGQTVSIIGQYFDNVKDVSFGSSAATSFIVVNNTTITAVVGTGHTGAVKVVTTGGNHSMDGFRYKVTWTGATNAFNENANWTGNRPPQTDDDIIFGSDAVSDLELDGSKTVGNVDFNGSGRALRLGSHNLTVKGNLTMPGNITGSGKVIMQGGSTQTITGGGDIPDLEINNSNGVTIDAAGEELTVSGTLRSTSGTLTTNGKLRLTSNNSGTARVGVVAGTITGIVITERFIKRNDNTDGTGRAWRLVSIPVTGTGDLRDFFLNGRTGQDLTLAASRDAETDNSGTPIVGHNYTTASEATTAGFDWIGVANSVSSLRSYVGDAAGGSFASENVPDLTTSYDAADQGYMVFARGDRKLDFPNTTSSSSTTFRSTGSLKTGTKLVSVAPASTSKYTLVGNPYMSVLNLDALYTTNSSVINPSFWIWDANISGTNRQGGYINVYKSGTQWVTNTGTYVNPGLLESGMAFFVEPVSSLSTPTNISILESHKSSASAAGLSPFTTNKPDDHGRMYIRLERADVKGQRQIIDGVMADFHTDHKVALTDMSDREKLRNGISRGALWIPREGKTLSGEGLPWPEDMKRSIPLYMSGIGDQTLLVHINPSGMRDRYVAAWLKDNVLKREVEINMNQPFDYDFIGTGRSDWDSTRFEIVYVEAGRPGTGVTLEPDDVAETPSVKLYPNPSKMAEVKLSLRAMAPGSYTVQVLDMTGRLVATSMLEHRSVNGEYRVLQYRMLSPGKYLLRLSTEGRLVQTLQLIHE